MRGLERHDSCISCSVLFSLAYSQTATSKFWIRTDLSFSDNPGSHRESNAAFKGCYRNDELVNDTYFQVSAAHQIADFGILKGQCIC